jgi:hypothetical protein
MKNQLSIILTLIEINIIVVILSLSFVMSTRNQQIQTTEARQQGIPESGSVEGQIKDKKTHYQQQLSKKDEIIQQYAQKFQEVNQQLQEYQLENQELTQINRLQQSRLTQALNQSHSRQKTLEVPPAPVYSVSTAIKVQETTREKAYAQNIAQSIPKKVSPTPHQPLKVNTETEKNQEAISEVALNKPLSPIKPRSSPVSIPDTAPLSRSFNRSLPPKHNQDLSIYYANDVAYGLAIAVNEGQINHGTRMYRKVQTAIRILRRGESKENAIRKAEVPEEVISQLLKWGEQRPGRLIAREIDHQPE